VRHQADRPIVRRMLLVVLVGLLGVAVVAPAVTAGARRHADLRTLPPRLDRLFDREPRARTAQVPRRQAPLRFGIYPGGGVGTVDAPALPVAEDRARRTALLGELRGGRDLVVHEYTALDGTDRLDGDLQWVEQELDTAQQAGLGFELVLRHRPAAADPDAAVAAYVRDVRQVVARIGRHPALTGLQVTNEANITQAPDAGDGASPGVRQALVRGVLAADEELRRLGRRDVAVGFNVAHGAPGDLRAFFADLRRLGGRPWARAVDWVGVDIYPATWSAPRAPQPDAVKAVVGGALLDLRRRHLPAAGLGRRVRLHVTENGFPTGPGRTDADQVAVMAASVAAVLEVRDRAGVSDFRWFDLRDADSASPHLEHQYGIVRSDFTRKPAFAVLQELVARYGRG
jgi:hypothetical protein